MDRERTDPSGLWRGWASNEGTAGSPVWQDTRHVPLRPDGGLTGDRRRPAGHSARARRGPGCAEHGVTGRQLRHGRVRGRSGCRQSPRRGSFTSARSAWDCVTDPFKRNERSSAERMDTTPSPTISGSPPCAGRTEPCAAGAGLRARAWRWCRDTVDGSGGRPREPRGRPGSLETRASGQQRR